MEFIIAGGGGCRLVGARRSEQKAAITAQGLPLHSLAGALAAALLLLLERLVKVWQDTALGERHILKELRELSPPCRGAQPG